MEQRTSSHDPMPGIPVGTTPSAPPPALPRESNAPTSTLSRRPRPWSSSARSIGRRVGRLLCVVIGSIVGMGAGELLLRWRGEEIPYHTRGRHLDLHFHPNPYLIPRVLGEVRYRTNSDGVRGTEIVSRDGPRILCLGGGAVECPYVDDAKTWPERLNVRLAEKGHSPWVGAIGRTDYVLRQHARFLRDASLLDRVDIVIVLAGANDVIAWLLGIEPVPAPRDWSERWAIAQAWRHWREPPTPIGIPLDDRGDEWTEGRMKLDFAPRELDLERRLAQYRQDLEEIVDVARQRNLRLVFVTHPVLWDDFLHELALPYLRYARVLPEPRPWSAMKPSSCRRFMDRFNMEMIDVAHRTNTQVIDVAPMSGDRYLFIDDVHLSDPGCDRLASLLADHLELSQPPSRHAP